MRGKQVPHDMPCRALRIIPAHAGQTRRVERAAFLITDHPRACGANCFSRGPTQRPTGSSPRMRGKQYAVLQLLLVLRIIPAHAGQTWWSRRGSGRLPDHPRACGANDSGVTSASERCGSSPRMRGKRQHRQVRADHERIIPAHAGQTARSLVSSGVLPDHPRACGANSVTLALSWPRPGSSPRMRGKRVQPAGIEERDRIIPAHAGQTGQSPSVAVEDADHPRACGANTYSPKIPQLSCGSSPRMRGKRRSAGRSCAGLRIIPAHAGQTFPPDTRMRWCSDHPRACGANNRHAHGHASNGGSSPRMRGKLIRGVVAGRKRRIIPAHAGQTRPAPNASTPPPDHPRACGANAKGQQLGDQMNGSSPRMRGKPVPSLRTSSTRRIIPAHAGQTRIRAGLGGRRPDHPRACGANAGPLERARRAVGSSPRMRGKPCSTRSCR